MLSSALQLRSVLQWFLHYHYLQIHVFARGRIVTYLPFPAVLFSAICNLIVSWAFWRSLLAFWRLQRCSKWYLRSPWSPLQWSFPQAFQRALCWLGAPFWKSLLSLEGLFWLFECNKNLLEAAGTFRIAPTTNTEPLTWLREAEDLDKVTLNLAPCP